MCTVLAVALTPVGRVQAGGAAVREVEKTLKTYPFSDPDPVARPGRIYPCFRFDGFAADGRPQRWRLVKLDNDFVTVWVAPGIGGKIWGAVEKETGREFIYFNHVVKFRDVALRGPWTSGGIELNFGTIGHAPTCSTPVNYLTRSNPDGSVSCVLGALDLPSRTRWRVEVRLPADSARFSTEALWTNPTPLEQSYYHWMNGAVQAEGDLELVYPGTRYIGHDGRAAPWPIDSRGRDLSMYENNDFGSYKSYHVLGAYTDFWGGYWHDYDFGFGHWAPYDEKPGKKIWIWGLSRQGMIWEDLLTDGDGQYVEVQSGRLFNQAAGSSTSTPFQHRGFAPSGADTWTEHWFPVRDTGGIRRGVPAGTVNFTADGGRLKYRFCANEPIDERLTFLRGGERLFTTRLDLDPMEVAAGDFEFAGDPDSVSVRLGDTYVIPPGGEEAQSLSRPVEPAPVDRDSAYGLCRLGREAARRRKYDRALRGYRNCLDRDPWFLPALNGTAHVLFRRMEYQKALEYATKALRVDTYDPHANFLYGTIQRQLGSTADALDGFAVASASPEYRPAARTEMARVHVRRREWPRALHYARRARTHNRYNLEAHRLEALVLRKMGRADEARRKRDDIVDLDPLSHFCRFESALAGDGSFDAFTEGITAELPHEYFLELAVWYHGLGLGQEARRVLELAPDRPVIHYWLAHLLDRAGRRQQALDHLERADAAPVRMVFPFRRETAPVLRWAAEHSDSWKPRYYLGLIHWSKGRTESARRLLRSCDDRPRFHAFYLSRARLLEASDPQAAGDDLRRALELDPASWRAARAMIRRHLEKGRIRAAERLSREAFGRHPDNYYLGLQRAGILLRTGQCERCLELLEDLVVLPNEGAQRGRRIYRRACLTLAVKACEKGDYDQAARLAAQARLWPENLGVGRPYNPDVRLSDYIEAVCLEKAGKTDEATRHFRRVADFEQDPAAGSVAPADLLSLLSMRRLGREKQAQRTLDRWSERHPDGRTVRWIRAWAGGDGQRARAIAREVKDGTAWPSSRAGRTEADLLLIHQLLDSAR